MNAKEVHSRGGQISVTCSSVMDTGFTTPIVKPGTTFAPVKGPKIIMFSSIGVIILVAAVVTVIICGFRRKHKSNKKSAGFENRTYAQSGLQHTVDERVNDLQIELHVNIQTTYQSDQNKVSDEQPYVGDCNAEQNYSTIDLNYSDHTYSSPYYSIESIPGKSTEHKSNMHEPELVGGQTNPSKVSGNSKNVQHTDFETYDHTNVEDNVLPVNEYSYLRNVDKYASDTSETYDKMLISSSRVLTTRENESDNETYDVTKI